MAVPRNEATDELFRSILALENIEECYRYFEDLCTVKEIQSMAQRLDIARRLYEGQSYSSTMEKTGACSATIGRVNRSLNYGAGGYDFIIERLK